MANLSRKSECQAHWRSISRCLQRFTAHPPHLSQVRQGRTDRHWERSSECRGALRFCAMAETFTMTEGEEAAREVREEGYLPKASWRGDRLESRSNAAFNKFPCRRLREALMFLSMAGRRGVDRIRRPRQTRPYLAHPTLSPLRSCPSSACYVPRIPHTRPRRTRR